MFLVNNFDGRGWCQVKDETGHTYGRLFVEEFAEMRRVGITRCAYWSCRCSCGNRVVVMGRSLRSGLTRSCGCLQGEARQRTGKANLGRPSFHKGKHLSAQHRQRLSDARKKFFRNQRNKEKYESRKSC